MVGVTIISSSPGLPNEEDGAVVLSEPIEQVFDEVTFVILLLMF